MQAAEDRLGNDGNGWDSTLFKRLRFLPDGDVEYRDGGGEIWRFRFSGGYTPPKDASSVFSTARMAGRNAAYSSDTTTYATAGKYDPNGRRMDLYRNDGTREHVDY